MAFSNDLGRQLIVRTSELPQALLVRQGYDLCAQNIMDLPRISFGLKAVDDHVA